MCASLYAKASPRTSRLLHSRYGGNGGQGAPYSPPWRLGNNGGFASGIIAAAARLSSEKVEISTAKRSRGLWKYDRLDKRNSRILPSRGLTTKEVKPLDSRRSRRTPASRKMVFAEVVSSILDSSHKKRSLSRITIYLCHVP